MFKPKGGRNFAFENRIWFNHKKWHFKLFRMPPTKLGSNLLIILDEHPFSFLVLCFGRKLLKMLSLINGTVHLSLYVLVYYLIWQLKSLPETWLRMSRTVLCVINKMNIWWFQAATTFERNSVGCRRKINFIRELHGAFDEKIFSVDSTLSISKTCCTLPKVNGKII